MQQSKAGVRADIVSDEQISQASKPWERSTKDNLEIEVKPSSETHSLKWGTPQHLGFLLWISHGRNHSNQYLSR